MGGVITTHQEEEWVRNPSRNFAMAVEFPSPSLMSTEAISPKPHMLTHRQYRRDPPESPDAIQLPSHCRYYPSKSISTLPPPLSTLFHRHHCQCYPLQFHSTNAIPSNPPMLSNHNPPPRSPHSLPQTHWRHPNSATSFGSDSDSGCENCDCSHHCGPSWTDANPKLPIHCNCCR